LFVQYPEDQSATKFENKTKQRLILAFLATLSIIHIVAWWRALPQLRAGYQDFTIFYTAGKILSRGQGPQLYDVALQHRIQQEFASRVTAREGPLGPYNHIPAEALLFIPFVQVSYFRAYILWDLLNLAALAAALFVLRPHLSELRNRSLAFWALLGLGFFPVYLTLLQGQDILLLLLILALAYSALRRDASFIAGCWLGLGLFRFPVVLPLALILCLSRKSKLLAGFSLAAAFMALLSVAAVGWKQMLDYPIYVLRFEHIAIGPPTSSAMPNLRGLIETLITGTVESWRFTAIILSLSIAFLWFTSSRVKFVAEKDRFDLSFSLAIIAAILASYHAYPHDLCILLLPSLLIADYCLRHRDQPHLGLIAPMLIFFLTPLGAFVLFRMNLACLFAIPLLAWFWTIARELSASPNPPMPRTDAAL
jgi:hypothetical protein